MRKDEGYVVVNSALGLDAAAPAKVLKEPKSNIRITHSKNPLKLAVARVAAEWLSAPDRTWKFNGSVDKNARRLRNYIAEMFPEFSWMVTPSQKAFDIISDDAKVAIEVKSVKGDNKKLTTNASVYPDTVLLGDVLSQGMVAEHMDLNTVLDVLVICVKRTEANKVYDFAIVDGSYWGVDYQDFLDCQAMFSNFKEPEFMQAVLALYAETYPEDSRFVEKILDGSFGNKFSFNLRKLIQVANPTGESLGISAIWK
jgi:hypothetical protein